ncbi:MAG: TIGR02253 family HAD-type hydrolase [Candidatus Altiarchaeota archaeon]
MIFFDIDNTLYDSTLQVEQARKNAVKAMIEAGLNANQERALNELRKIVKRHGSNYSMHYNELVKKFNFEENPRIIAAGIVAYHNTKLAFLTPFPETVPTLLKLRELGYKLGVITDGKAIKQWEKLIRLGLQHFFDLVLISEEIGIEKSDEKIFKFALEKIKCEPSEAIMVGDRLDKDILGANKIGMLTIKILRGRYSEQQPKIKDEKPLYEISNLREIFSILEKIERKKC